MTSPPALVIMAARTVIGMLSRRYRTLPSAKATFAPPAGVAGGRDRSGRERDVRRLAVVLGNGVERQAAQRRLVVHGGEAELLQVALALHPRGRLPDLLDGREDQTDQDREDRDDHYQLDECESVPLHLSSPSSGESCTGHQITSRVPRACRRRGLRRWGSVGQRPA